MVEFERNLNAPAGNDAPLKACIVGVGGAGSNVLDRITLDRTMEATLLAVHTDVRVLGHSMAPHKVQLGAELMRGVGAGGDPDLGREAALFSRDEIKRTLAEHEVIFVCTGLGGGTGSGAAPVIAEIAKGTGALVLVVATMPFGFEGRRRINQAEEALELLQKRADALILFENDRMGELILPKDGIQKAFSSADQLIAQSLRAVSTMISTPGLVKLGLDDLTASLRSSNGRCLFGFGEARGKTRGVDALKRALNSPLIDQGRLLHHTKNLLVHVAGGESLTLAEVEDIMKQVGRNVPDDTQILFGVAADAKLGDAVSVTLISSLEAGQLASHVTVSSVRRAVEPISVRREPVAATSEPAPRPEPEATLAEPADEPVFQEAFVEERFPAREPELEREEVERDLPPAGAGVEAPPLDLFGMESVPTAPMKPVGRVKIPDEVVEEPVFQVVAPPPVKPNTQEESRPEVVAPMPETSAVPLPERSEPVDAGLDEDEAQPPQARAQADPDVDPQPAKEPSGNGLLATVIKNRAPANEDGAASDMFERGAQERGRFKNTEPSLVEGEDLDVPTWMRLKKKMKR